MRRLAIFFLAVLLSTLVWLAVTGRLARLSLAARMLDHLRRPIAGSAFMRTTHPPRETALTLEYGGQRFAAELYRPAAAAGNVPIVLTPGAVAQGKDDPRIAPFARLLARAGFTVIVPDLTSFRTLRIRSENAEQLGAALEAVVRRADLAPRGTAGLFGISYAGGIAMLVATDPRHARHVRFVAAVGAYADLDTVVRYLATGRFTYRGRQYTNPPDLYGKFVFLRTYEEFLTEPEDVARLESMAERRLRDPRAAMDDLAAGLTPAGRLVYDLFERSRPDEVPALIARLPAGMKQRMAMLSPARRDFSPLRARVYLLHDLHDRTFPFTETLTLAERSRELVPVRMILLESLHHADPKPWHNDPWGFLTRDLPEAWRLGWWFVDLLGERS